MRDETGGVNKTQTVQNKCTLSKVLNLLLFNIKALGQTKTNFKT